MLKNIVIAVIVVFCLMLLCLHSESRFRKAVRPPNGATNLTTFLLLRPYVIEITKFSRNGSLYLEVLGRTSTSGLSLPSGRPAYVFDESGILVDWAADTGEATDFNNKWGKTSNASPVTVEEAKALTSQKKGNHR